MADTFPFQVHQQEDADSLSINRVFSILVDAGGYEYGDVFERYGYSGNGPSWGEHV